MKPSFLLAFIFSCAAIMTARGAAIHDSNADDKCHGLDCPTYKVLNKTNTWELRRYGQYKWASTNGTAMDKDTINSVMFHILFDYISGKNAKNTKIPMTSPVLTRVAHGQGPTCESSFTMHFMIPLNQQDDPIAPTDPRVFIGTTPQLDVFVRSFDGFATEQDYIDNVSFLSKDVAAVAKVEGSYFYTAGYDGPYQFLNRHNEVWLVKL